MKFPPSPDDFFGMIDEETRCSNLGAVVLTSVSVDAETKTINTNYKILRHPELSVNTAEFIDLAFPSESPCIVDLSNTPIRT
jgi:hypothetical protein